MKVREAFSTPVRCEYDHDGIPFSIVDSHGDLLIDGETTYEETNLEVVAMTINHHDKMVDKLRELADWFGQQDCGYCVGVADDLEKLLVEVSQ